MSLVDEYLARTPGSAALFERATAVAARRLDADDDLQRAVPAVHGPRRGHPDVGRRRQRVPRLPRQLHVADPRPRPPGGRRRGRGAGALAARRSRRRPRPRSSWPRRFAPRLPSIERDPVHELRHRGDDVRASARRVRSPAGRWSPSSSSPTTARTTRRLAWTPGVPAATSDLVLELPWGDPEGVERAIRGPASASARRDHHRAGAGRGRRSRRRPRLPAVPARAHDRGSARCSSSTRSSRSGSDRTAPRAASAACGRTSRRSARSSAAAILRRVRRPRRRDGPVRRPPLRRAGATAARSTATRSPPRPASRRCAT